MFLFLDIVFSYEYSRRLICQYGQVGTLMKATKTAGEGKHKHIWNILVKNTWSPKTKWKRELLRDKLDSEANFEGCCWTFI